MWRQHRTVARPATADRGRRRAAPGRHACPRSRGLLALALLAGVLGVTQMSGAPAASADNHTISQDTLRTGWYPAEPSLPPSTVTGSTFGQLFATKVRGQVYAQPLVIGGTVVVSTEDDWVYGLDAINGAVKWSRNLGPAWPASTNGCADLTPNIGNTSTGVYDSSSNLVYLTTKVNDGPDADHPNWYLHALDVTTGAERTGWPVRIVGTPANDPAHPFGARDLNQRPGLLLDNGVVYMAFGSQCDYGTFVGTVAGVDTTTKAINLWSDEVGASSNWAGIWQSGGGIVSDGPGRMFVSTGNGVTAPDGPGSPPPQQLSQSVVRLGVDADGVISARDFYSPWNAATLDQNDTDLGSGGPVALPDQYFGTPAIPHLMVVIGKEGRLLLLNRDRLGGKAQGPGGTDDIVQSLGPYRGVWGHPAVYGGQGGYVYVVQDYDTMLAFRYAVDGQGKPALALAGNSLETFGYTAGSPIVTSDGTAPGSAVVWVINVDGPSGANGRLGAYDGIPSNGRMTLLRCFPIGTAAKFATPAASNGRIYAGTRDGYVYGFGQPTTAALTAGQTSFGNVAVSQTGTATVKATATRTVTVTGVSTSAPFGATPPQLPVTLTAGQTISVPVSFMPTAPGSVTGSLSFSITDAGTTGTVAAGLQGTGIKPGFTASPASVDFGQVPVGNSKSLTVTFTNTGASDETVTAVTAPSAPFTATGLPSTGTVVTPGQSIAVSVTYKPTTTGSNTSSVKISGPDGTGTAALDGSGVTGTAKLSISPTALDFGSVPVGLSATQTLTIANTGNLDVTITKAAPPALPFVVNTPLPEGLVLGPDDEVQVQVTFAPTVAGSYHNLYVISSDDGNGAHEVDVTGTATEPLRGTPLPSLVNGAWHNNGSAHMSGSDLVLTTADRDQAGSTVFSTPLPADGLSASFTAQIGGGTGADGMTFAMLSAASNGATSLGVGGGGLGFAGLPGVAVTLDTYRGGNDPSSNFIGLSTGTTDGVLTYVATATDVPDLRSGTHRIAISATGGSVTVSVDGGRVISAGVSLPPSVLVAFTGSTGGATDQHVIRDASVTSGGTTLPQPGTGWSYNGSATANGASTVLTPAQLNRAGSVLYSQPVNTNGLSTSFNLSIGGGTGADGTSFVMLDPATSPTSVGGPGNGLGYSGLAGVAVTFATYPEHEVDSHNFVGVATSTSGGTPSFLASSTAIPDLHTGTHNAVIGVSDTTVTVSIDGTKVLQTQVPSLAATAIVGYTGSTGGLTDVHSITNAQIVAGGAGLPSPPGGCWTTNGSTTTSGDTVQLTAAAPDQTGTAICGTAISPARLDATFTVRIGDGTGADGLTFMLLDAAVSTPTSMGQGGGGLGFSGLSGVAVAFVTYPQDGYPSSNFVGISAGGSGRALTFASTATNVPDLRTGTHSVHVHVGAGGHLIVGVDGVQVLDSVVDIPASALVGYSGATGGATDVHAVSGVTVTY
jgi:hypothetical protein